MAAFARDICFRVSLRRPLFQTPYLVLNRAKVVVLDQVVLSDASQAIPSSDSSTRGFGGGGGFGGGMPMPR